jgi:hypothetical protein
VGKMGLGQKKCLGTFIYLLAVDSGSITYLCQVEEARSQG